jgi:cupin superfamily acireductone dioxygenase involved in methionine salvage
VADVLIKWEELAWIGGDRAKRKVVQTETATFALQELTHSLPEPKVDQHPEQQVVLLLSGTSDFYVDDVLYKMEAGDMLVIPSNATHYQKITSPEGIKNFLIFTPANSFKPSEKIAPKE